MIDHGLARRARQQRGRRVLLLATHKDEEPGQQHGCTQVGGKLRGQMRNKTTGSS